MSECLCFYVGVIEKSEANGTIIVSFMTRYRQSFQWPSKPDVQILNKEEILCKIAPPVPINSRCFKIENVEEINAKLNQMSK